jgi:hypothetical protein
VANKAAAEALYNEALELLNRNAYQEALDKLLASQRIDPALGTLLNIGYCYERLNKTASAWATYNEVVGLARAANDQQGRGDRAAQAARALEPKLAKVIVAVPAESRVEKLEVRRDGDVIDPGTWGTPIPTDPGAHTFEVSAPGRAAWSTSIVVAQGPSSVTITVPPLAAGAGAWGGRRIAGVAVAGVGVAGMIAGAVFGGLAIAKHDEQATHCLKSNPHLCDATGVDLRGQALTMANASNVALGVGAAAIAAGAVLFFTAPKPVAQTSSFEVRLSPVVTAEARGAFITGRW